MMGISKEHAQFMEDLTGHMYQPSVELTKSVNQWLEMMSERNRFIVEHKWGINGMPKLKTGDLVKEWNEAFGCKGAKITPGAIREKLNRLRRDFYYASNSYKFSCIAREIRNQEGKELWV